MLTFRRFLNLKLILFQRILFWLIVKYSKTLYPCGIYLAFFTRDINIRLYNLLVDSVPTKFFLASYPHGDKSPCYCYKARSSGLHHISHACSVTYFLLQNFYYIPSTHSADSTSAVDSASTEI